jgi:hypothetical protein
MGIGRDMSIRKNTEGAERCSETPLSTQEPSAVGSSGVLVSSLLSHCSFGLLSQTLSSEF